MRVLTGSTIAALLVFTLVGCGQEQGSTGGDGSNFIAGDGSLVLLDADHADPPAPNLGSPTAHSVAFGSRD